MRWVSWLLGPALVLAATVSSQAKTPALLELKVGETSYQGRLALMADDYCWLMGRDGRLDQVELGKVESHRVAAPEFRRYSPAELRDLLRREFRTLEVAGTEHYLVCAPKGKAGDYAQVFEGVYRSFHLYASTRGFRVARPEFPLVAVVFPNHAAFADYCKKDDVPAMRGMLGYYMPTTNRVALYEPETQVSVRGQRSDVRNQRSEFESMDDGPCASDHGRAFARIEGDLQDTMIHEATHQVAFNVGLHSRIGESPLWVVEGLATVFEAPGIRESASNTSIKSRLNRERFVWFGNYMKERRKPKSLAQFVSSDAAFKTAVLDAYSEAWALSFYLIETRPGEYARHLKKIAERDPLKEYGEGERLADFQRAFGKDLTILDADFIRFFEALK